MRHRNVASCKEIKKKLYMITDEKIKNSIMMANLILLQKKYSRVIECFAKQQGLSLDAALDFFYHSQVYQLIRDGVSDMHCMSDVYLAEELKQEYEEKVPEKAVVKERIK